MEKNPRARVWTLHIKNGQSELYFVHNVEAHKMEGIYYPPKEERHCIWIRLSVCTEEEEGGVHEEFKKGMWLGKSIDLGGF